MKTLIATLSLLDIKNIQSMQIKVETSGTEKRGELNYGNWKKASLDSVKFSERIPNIQHPQ